MAYPTGMALIWFHFIHVPRGLFGIFIVMKKTPKAYEIIEQISEFDQNEMKEKWNFEQIAFHLRNNFKKNISSFINDAKAYFLIYFVLSALNTVIDLIGLIIQVALFGSSTNIYEPLFLIGVI